MRGPKLVGYPPTGLRWSGDSHAPLLRVAPGRATTRRRPGSSARDGGQPRKLTDEERRSAPPVNGRWDKAHRRVLFVDRGDIVLLDTVSGTRRQITRTTGNEGESALGAPRNGDHLHARQQPVPRPARQRRDRAAHRRAAAQARAARHRQPEVHQGRRAEADRAHADRGGEEEEGRGEGQGATRCRSSSSPIARRRAICSSRPTASTSSSSSSSAPRPPSGPTCRTTSPSRATPRTSRRAPSSATRRTAARWRS